MRGSFGFAAAWGGGGGVGLGGGGGGAAEERGVVVVVVCTRRGAFMADAVVGALRGYLAAVYPASHARLSALDSEELRHRFEALDYYYSTSEAALSSVRPQLSAPLQQLSTASSALPYIPAGAYYRALGHAPLDGGRFNAIQWGSYDRHQLPVELLSAALARDRVPRFHSSFGARIGPQPSWTSPLAVVRYVHYPSGLERDEALQEPLSARRRHVDHRTLRKAPIVSADAYLFDVANSSRVVRLRQLRDGDMVEVELWGGLLNADECPPICGTWANIWQGTGVFMRVRHPFVTLNKATALVEMFAALGERNATGLVDLLDLVGATERVREMRKRHPRATLADCLSAYMLSVLPRAGGHRDPAFGQLVASWEQFALRSPPQRVVQHALRLGSAASVSTFSSARRFALHWTFGINGKGRNTPFWRGSPVGPDGLISTLACVLGHQTVVLAASSNDNGLLHQELVDFELPEPLGWPSVKGRRTNDARWCLSQPFRFVRDDAKRGSKAQTLRRLRMLQHWRYAQKFRLPTDPGGAADQPTAPCDITFGSGADGGAGELSACRGPKVRVPRPTAGRACYAWCNGTLSSVLADVSLGHVRYNAGAT